MKTARLLSITALLATCAVSSAFAIVIDFEGTGVAPAGVISPVPLPYHEDGFLLRNGIPAAESGIFGAATDGLPISGSDFFGWAFNGSIILEAESGDPFTFNSFDAGHIGDNGLLPDVLTLRVTGNLSGGGSIVANFDYTNPWQTFVLPGTFTDLVSVEFLTSFDGSAGIDNLVINADDTRVPDGSQSVVLLGMAMVALAGIVPFSRRRRD
jgi:hypothetical protein